MASPSSPSLKRRFGYTLVVSLRSIESTHAEVLENTRTEADYFERNADKMRYPKFRCQRLLVGSGVIEAG